MNAKGPKGIGWLLVFAGVLLAGCGPRFPKVSPPLEEEAPSGSQQPTPEEEVLYGYLVTLASGDFERLQAFASPQAFDRAQRWWQSLSAQERRLFRQNMSLLSRTGKVGFHNIAFNLGPWPLLVFDPMFNAEAPYRYPEVDLRGAEGYILETYPALGEKPREKFFCLFVLRLHQVEVNAKRVEHWKEICWTVHPYPGEIPNDRSFPVTYSSSLRCVTP